MLILNPFEKLQKMSSKKIDQQKSDVKMGFFFHYFLRRFEPLPTKNPKLKGIIRQVTINEVCCQWHIRVLQFLKLNEIQLRLLDICKKIKF